MSSRLAQWKSLGAASWLRIAGILVLLFGLGGASLLYWSAHTGARTRTTNDLMPGYAEARARQRAILMGSVVAGLMDDLDALHDPDTQAAILAIVATITALGCFRIASMIRSDEESQPDKDSGHNRR
jgi:hypothetical protein